MEADSCIEKQQLELENVVKQLDDKVQQIVHCEDIIEQLTNELNLSQDELRRTYEKLGKAEDVVIELKDNLEERQREVSLAIFIFNILVLLGHKLCWLKTTMVCSKDENGRNKKSLTFCESQHHRARK
jgi:flagellin-specific chaperone FliS